MGMIIHRIEKYHTINAIKRHNGRHNEHTVRVCDSNLTDAILRKKYNARKNAVLAIEGLYTASPDAIAQMDDETLNSFFEDCIAWHKKQYPGPIISIDIHFDESTGHMHILSVPLINEKLNARQIIGNRKDMADRQSDIADTIGVKYGLARGVKHSKAKHLPLMEREEALQLIHDLQEQYKVTDEMLKQLQDKQEQQKGIDYNDIQ